MATTHSDTQALDVLRWMASATPPTISEAIGQTLRVWPMLHIGDKVRHYARARELCETTYPGLRNRELIAGAECALEAQSRLFLA
jgi:hypothetical protein